MNVPPSKISDGWLKKFILAGNATFTIRSNKTGTRFTYNVRKPGELTPHFVSVLAGPDNETSYLYLGTIFNSRDFAHGKKSRIEKHAPSSIAASWALGNILRDKPLMNCEVWHEGRCGRCGRKLTVPESIESGFGPECITKI